MAAGDTASFSLTPGTDDVPVEAPADLEAALAHNPRAQAQWDALTPKAREAWIQWIDQAKKAQTRTGRIATTMERLTRGAKRPGD